MCSTDGATPNTCVQCNTDDQCRGAAGAVPWCGDGRACPAGMACQLDGYCHPADSCFIWKELDFSQGAPPDMFRGNYTQQPYEWPMITRIPPGNWLLGAGNQETPSEYWGASEGTPFTTVSDPAAAATYGSPNALQDVSLPVDGGKKAIYLALAEGCQGRDVYPASDPGEAVTFNGHPVCYDFSSWAAGSVGALTPYLSDTGGCGQLWGANYLGENYEMGNDYRLLRDATP